MTYEQKEKIAQAKERDLAAQYATIGQAREACKWGGECASCMYRISSVQVGADIMDRMYTRRDYCRAS